MELLFKNRADILFDYNAAVLTNITNNVIDLGLGIASTDFENGISVYPNPLKTS